MDPKDEQNDEIDLKKCYNCNKTFRTPAELARHKNRKTPCLIANIPEDKKEDPNKCIFCNRILTTKQNLEKHHTRCKIKNGGMDILVEKVKHDKRVEKLEEENRLLKERLDRLEQNQNATVINNTTNITNTTNNTVIQNNIEVNLRPYLTPSIEHLFNMRNIPESKFIKMFKQNPLELPMKLVVELWFNLEAPENHSIYLVNKSTGETMVYTGKDWQHETFEKIGSDLRDLLIKIINKIYKDPKFGLAGQYDGSMRQLENRKDIDAARKQDYKHIYNVMVNGRRLSKKNAQDEVKTITAPASPK